MAAILAAVIAGQDAATASNAAQMVDYYNRQLHPDQLKILAELSKNSGMSVGDYTAVLCVIQNCDINGLGGYDKNGQSIYQAGLELRNANPEQFNRLVVEIKNSGALSGQFAYQPGSLDFTKDAIGSYWNDKYNGVLDLSAIAMKRPDDLASLVKGAVKGIASNVKDAPSYPLDNADEIQGAIWGNLALAVAPLAKGATIAGLGALGEAWEISKILSAGEVAASARGSISSQQMTRMGVPAALSDGELAKLGPINSLDSTAAGIVRETVADSYFQRNGFTALDGKCGANCFDGVYIKGDQVIINEVKPLNANNTIQLNGPNEVTGLQTQMTKQWIESRIDVLTKSGDPAKIATAQAIQKAIDNGTLVKMVSGVNGNGMTMVKLK